MVFALVAPCILREIGVIPNFAMGDRDKTSQGCGIKKGDANGHRISVCGHPQSNSIRSSSTPPAII